MNLYNVTHKHIAPRGWGCGIVALLLAENDEQVYEWIASQPRTSLGVIDNDWKLNENAIWDEENEVFIDENDEYKYWYDDYGNPESFKKRMLRQKGELNDSAVDVTDAFYGVTLLGWHLLKENVETDYSELIELGIAYVA